MPEQIARRLTQAFTTGALDLSQRPSAPPAGWDGMPEVYSAARVLKAGADPRAARLFLTLTTALDYSRDSDRLWTSAASLYEQCPWVFEPNQVVARPDETRVMCCGSGA